MAQNGAPVRSLRHNSLHAIILNMGLREDIQKRIDRKRAEIAAMEKQTSNAAIYIQALEDTLKLLPRESGETEAFSASSSSSIRPGSKVDKARGAIRKAGRPLHITLLVAAIGRPNTAAERAALAGSMSSYARRGEVFTRPAPNTFGLLDLKAQSGVSVSGGPPPHFGIDQKAPEESAIVEDDTDEDWLDETLAVEK